MGYVYKIKFPEGKYYIGSTNNLRARMSNHRSSGPLSSRIKELNYTVDMLIENASILYQGNRYVEAEKRIIFTSRDCSDMLNKRVKDPDSTNFITVAKKQLGITQRELALVLGVSIRTVQHYEQGTCKPSQEVLRKLKKETAK